MYTDMCLYAMACIMVPHAVAYAIGILEFNSKIQCWGRNSMNGLFHDLIKFGTDVGLIEAKRKAE